MDAKGQIVKALRKATNIEQIELEVPEVEAHGDYSSNIAMQYWTNLSIFNFQFSNKKYKSPRELAEHIVNKLSKDKELSKSISKIEVAGPGFINFHLTRPGLVTQLNKYSQGKFDIPNIGKGRAVVVEYSSPNIAKPFTIGHLRSTTIGDAVANLLDTLDYKVYRDNHLGDWGTQFGKQIYAIKTWGDEQKIEKSTNPVKELVTLYVRFHKEAERDSTLEDKARAWFKKLEDGDPEARRLWKKCVEWSWKEFDRIYVALGVKFSSEFESGRGLGESYFEDKMPAVLDELEKKKLLKEGEQGAQMFYFEGDKYPPAMILKKDGATLYHTRDLATDRYRLDTLGKEILIINEVGSEQTLYFRQLFEMEKVLGWVKDGQRVHIAHGLIRFKEGKMSTRKGNVIWLEEILKEAKKRAYRLAGKSGLARAEWGKPEELILRKTVIDKELVSGARDKDIESVAVGAIKWNDLKRDPKTAIVFDWDEIVNMEGNSGPYLQYTYARCKSVLRKSETCLRKQGVKERESGGDAKGPSLSVVYSNEKLSTEELSLLRTFIHYPEVIQVSAERYAPNLLCNYLYDLAQKYNSFYNSDKIIGSDNQDFRLLLTKATANTLSHGLGLLGIQAPERM